ncbi:hypothetical protein Ancab_004051 [Ancistrocladus abbreviatus]
MHLFLDIIRLVVLSRNLGIDVSVSCSSCRVKLPNWWLWTVVYHNLLIVDWKIREQINLRLCHNARLKVLIMTKKEGSNMYVEYTKSRLWLGNLETNVLCMTIISETAFQGVEGLILQAVQNEHWLPCTSRATNAWPHINLQKPNVKGLLKPSIPDVEHEFWGMCKTQNAGNHASISVLCAKAFVLPLFLV